MLTAPISSETQLESYTGGKRLVIQGPLYLFVWLWTSGQPGFFAMGTEEGERLKAEEEEEETQLTVQRTSHFFVGDGFSVYDSKPELVFRVECYGYDSKHRDQLLLMDGPGKPLYTVHKKRPSLHHRWEGFLGENIEGQNPIFSVRRSSIIGHSGATVYVYGSEQQVVEEYQIEGSYSNRCCTFYNSSREVVAEIKRKVDASANVVLGKDVFCLCLKPGIDAAFAMALILVLEQIDGQDDVSANIDDEHVGDLTVGDSPLLPLRD